MYLNPYSTLCCTGSGPGSGSDRRQCGRADLQTGQITRYTRGGTGRQLWRLSRKAHIKLCKCKIKYHQSYHENIHN